MKLNKFLISLIITLVIICIPALVMSGPIDPNCDPDCPYIPGCPPECIPFDSGIFLLIAVGIGIGAKKTLGKKASSHKL